MALQQLQGPRREQERCKSCHKHSFTRSPNPADPFLMSAAFVGSAVISSTGGSGAAAAVLNPLCVLGAVGLGVSLVQIHIYVDPLKKALQVGMCEVDPRFGPRDVRPRRLYLDGICLWSLGIGACAHEHVSRR
jgi:hypothetical protein